METCINYCSPEAAYVSSDERRWITVIRKLKEKYPDEVKIIREPEKNDGCIYATVPIPWVKILHPKKMNLTEEQRIEIGNRLKNSQKQLHSKE